MWMKKIHSLLWLLIGSLFTLQAQTVLEPTEKMALLQVLVTSIDGVPSAGDKVSFINNADSVAYSGVSDKDGRFNILVPKGTSYNIKVTVIGKDTLIRKNLQIPSEPEYITINYTFKYEPPRTIRLDRVYFDTNKSTLKPESKTMLQDLYEFLSAKPTINIEIAGHTDNVGGAAFNLKLSQDRANAVKTFLINKGIDANRLTPKGYGLTRPIDTNDTPEGRAKNRRTEVYIIEKTTTN